MNAAYNTRTMPDSEFTACIPEPIVWEDFNPSAVIPYGCQPWNVFQAMTDFLEFLGFLNQQLYSQQMQRLESLIMPANFSSIVGEFMHGGIAKYCEGLVKNRYPNGHPDLVPAGVFPNDAVQHTQTGIEIKASRYRQGWQGHNPEAIWLMVFVFDSNRPTDTIPMPFRFEAVFGAQLALTDWRFSGRSATSRRTITASISRAGYDKLTANWIYRRDSRFE